MDIFFWVLFGITCLIGFIGLINPKNLSSEEIDKNDKTKKNISIPKRKNIFISTVSIASIFYILAYSCSDNDSDTNKHIKEVKKDTNKHIKQIKKTYKNYISNSQRKFNFISIKKNHIIPTKKLSFYIKTSRKYFSDKDVIDFGRYLENNDLKNYNPEICENRFYEFNDKDDYLMAIYRNNSGNESVHIRDEFLDKNKFFKKIPYKKYKNLIIMFEEYKKKGYDSNFKVISLNPLYVQTSPVFLENESKLNIFNDMKRYLIKCVAFTFIFSNVQKVMISIIPMSGKTFNSNLKYIKEYAITLKIHRKHFTKLIKKIKQVNSVDDLAGGYFTNFDGDSHDKYLKHESLYISDKFPNRKMNRILYNDYLPGLDNFFLSLIKKKK